MTNTIDTSHEPYDRKVDGVLANLSIDPARAPTVTGPRKVGRDTRRIIAAHPNVLGVERRRKGAHYYTYPGMNGVIALSIHNARLA